MNSFVLTSVRDDWANIFYHTVGTQKTMQLFFFFFERRQELCWNYIRRGKIKNKYRKGKQMVSVRQTTTESLRPLGWTQRHHFPWEESRNKPLTTPVQSTDPTETTKTTEKENTETPRPKETKRLAIPNPNNRSRCQLKLPNIIFAEYATWLVCIESFWKVLLFRSCQIVAAVHETLIYYIPKRPNRLIIQFRFLVTLRLMLPVLFTISCNNCLTFFLS